MKLRVRDVEREKSIDWEESIPADRICLDSPDRPVVVSPVHVVLQATAEDGRAWVSVSAQARVALSCARCVDRFTIALNPAFELDVPLDGGDIDVDEDIRQHMLLGLPVMPLCRPDCRGLCPGCGAHLSAGGCSCPPQTGRSPFDDLKRLKNPEKDH